MADKITQGEAGYTDQGKGLRVCAFCSMWRFGPCTLVQSVPGPIKPLGQCKFWENMLTGKERP